jgi:MoaA/NifB/PqqE/SkfB family radical SAM enzyme
MNRPEKKEGFGEKAYFKKLFRLKKLEGVFLFVTSRCNSKCRTCFYGQELNRNNDLTFEQIQRLSETAPSFDKLWISGGEPFLRPEFVDIIETFYRNNGISTINLPTNGLLPDRTVEWTGQILDRCPNLVIHLNFSVDGFAPTNDSIRGVPGGFHRVMESMEKVEATHGHNPRLHFNAATVLTPENFEELIDLSRYLFKRFPGMGFHLSEPARGTSPDPSVQALSRADVERMHERFRPVLDTTGERLFRDLRGWKRFLGELGYTGLISYMFRLTEENHEGPHPWGMRCPAGETTIVIDADGRFRSCEIREPIGHLFDYDYDLTAAFRSEAMQAEIQAIGGGYRANCWCTHGCWISSALKFAPWVLLTRVPSAYREHKRNSPGPLDLDSVDLDELEERYRSRLPHGRGKNR